MKLRRIVASGAIAVTAVTGVGVAVTPAGAATPAQCATARAVFVKAKAVHAEAVTEYRRLRQVEARLRAAGKTNAADRLDAALDRAKLRNDQLLARAAQAKTRYQAECGSPAA